MLDRKQAEAAAEALMSKPQAAQDVARHDAVMARRVAIQRRTGGWGLAGMLVGSVIGHFAFGAWFPSAMVGFAVGAIIGRWVIGRQA